MSEQFFQNKCITDTVEGLREGLSHFSKMSRVALLYAVTPDDPIRIYDPQQLLRGHEPKFKELYLDSPKWRDQCITRQTQWMIASGDIQPEENLELAGLISFGARSHAIFYQMWFTEHHPDMCAIGPTERWLEHAAWRLSHDFCRSDGAYTGISGHFLREYATHAVRDYILDLMNLRVGWDSNIRVYPVLDAILGLSKTREEGKWPHGKLMVVEPRAIDEMEIIAKFPASEQPRLDHFKHVRKILQAVEHSDRKLISDGECIVGVSNACMPRFSIIAEFLGNKGFLFVNDEKICSISDGRFHSTTFQAKLVEVEEALLESRLDPETGNHLFRIIASIVHFAQEQNFGCALIVDLHEIPIPIAGQLLEPPIDLRDPHLLDLAKSLSKVDGALHIGADLKLHRFACLMDGRRGRPSRSRRCPPI